MAEDYKIRDFESCDSEKIISLLERCGLRHEPWDNNESYERKNRIDPGMMVVAESEGNVIGFVLGQYDGWGSMIWRLAVDENFRGKGIGSHLLREISSRLNEKGAKNIYALVSDSNEYADWWKKKGWYFDTKCWTIGLED